MKKTAIILLFILVTLFFNCEFKNDRQEYAEKLIEEVETFKKVNNRLPRNITELGLTEYIDSPAFYQMESSTTYIIWYGLGLGESKIYKSATKKWIVER